MGQQLRSAIKLGYVPSVDKKFILGASILNRDLSAFLRNAIAKDESILNVEILAQNGVRLAMTAAETWQPPTNTQPIRTVEDLASTKADAVTLEIPVASSVPVCCECAVKGVIKDANDTSYVMRLTLSLKDLRAAASARQQESFMMLGAAACVSLVLGYLTTRRLVMRLSKISQTTRRVLETGDLTLKAEEGRSDDEVTLLARGLNTMMATLKQNETYRAEKASLAARAKVASQAAHDIRSPLAALQVVADNADGLPEDFRLLPGRGRSYHGYCQQSSDQASYRRHGGPNHSG